MAKALEFIGFIIKSIIAGLALAFVIVFFMPELRQQILPTQTPVTAQPGPVVTSYADAVNRAAPSVVSIYTQILEQQIRPLSPQFQRLLGRSHIRRIRQREEIGSGVIISEDGYIITNQHVVNQVQNINIQLWDGRFADAEIIGFDLETDLAVLKIEMEDLPVAPLAEDYNLRVGDVVLAIGNALGLSHTVTMGIISATGRNDLNATLYEDFIQTDAAINQGNSGGALINANGEVIGINSRSFSDFPQVQNISFAIPISLASNIMQQIIEYGAVRRGWLGATFSDLPITAQGDGNNIPQGIQVQEVDRSGPAWQSGLRGGDIIMTLDNEMVNDARAFLFTISQKDPGTQVELQVSRNGQNFSTYARLVQQPPLLR